MSTDDWLVLGTALLAGAIAGILTGNWWLTLLAQALGGGIGLGLAAAKGLG